MLQIYPECGALKRFNGSCWICPFTDLCAANKQLGCTLEENCKVIGKVIGINMEVDDNDKTCLL